MPTAPSDKITRTRYLGRHFAVTACALVSHDNGRNIVFPDWEHHYGVASVCPFTQFARTFSGEDITDSPMQAFHGTTILSVRNDQQVAVGGDGQVSSEIR